jgi:hypothetical protein
VGDLGAVDPERVVIAEDTGTLDDAWDGEKGFAKLPIQWFGGTWCSPIVGCI